MQSYILLSAGMLVGPTSIFSLVDSAADTKIVFGLSIVSELITIIRTIAIPIRSFLDMSLPLVNFVWIVWNVDAFYIR